MRNLIRIHFKRFLFRWETIAASLINIFLGIFSAIFIPEMYTDAFSGSEYFYPALYLTSLSVTMSSVIMMESNSLNNGTIRNQLIAGYTKLQVYMSKYITDLIYGIIQGVLMMWILPFSGIADDYSILFAVSLILIYGAVSCIVMTFCMLSDRRATSVLICIACLFTLMLGGINIAKRLDTQKYIYESSRDHETVVKTENLFYIDSPIRDVLEQAVRSNPMQPVYEYILWYLPRDEFYYTPNEVRMDYDPVYNLQWKQIEAEYQRHIGRLNVFPIYQISFIAAVCNVGAIIFRKRNLK